MARRRLPRRVRLASKIHYNWGFFGRNENHYALNVYLGKKLLGQIDFRLDHRAKLLMVGANVIEDERYERRGIGTRLYEEGAALACRMGVKFGSSAVLNKKSGGFWKKQERKGRARLVSHTDHRGRRHRIYVIDDPCKHHDLSALPRR